jgi:polysaccharide export outer membrane protein
MRTSIVALTLLATSNLFGCGSTAPFVWHTQLAATDWQQGGQEYVIGVGDGLEIKVYDQDNVSVQAHVRDDGRLALPLAGEIVAAGKTPLTLSREVEQRLKEFIVNPRVTVNVTESVPISISVLGEVGSRGTLTLKPPITLIQVLAQSGGLSAFADEDSIYVLRKTPQFKRIRFTYDALLRNTGGAATFALRSGDVVVVE